MKKVFIMVSVFLACMVLSFTAGMRYRYRDFQNGGLEMLVKEHLNKHGVAIEEMWVLADGLFNLDIRDSTISNLKVLYGIPLKTLVITGTEVTDLSPLSEFKTLEELDISATGVTDLTPLSELRQLRKLKMDVTKISSLSPLSGLPLEELYISRASIQDLDLTPITNMPLRILGFVGTAVTNAGVILQTDIQEILFSPSDISTEQLNLLRRKKFLSINSYKDNDRFWQDFDKEQSQRLNE